MPDSQDPNTSAPQKAYPAGLGRRVGAMLYDSLLIIALFFLTGFIWVPLSGDVVTGVAFQLTLLAEVIFFRSVSFKSLISLVFLSKTG